jgi:predicted small lipoprotein YifL
VPSQTCAAVALLVIAVALAGCGRKGPLEPPPGAQTEKVTAADGTVVERPVRPNRPFVLDGLLN